MGKNKALFYYLWFYITLFSFTIQNAYSNTNSLNERLKLQKVYRAEIGVKESTGNNDGPRVKEYLATCNLPEGNYWCAAYITWSYLEANIKAIRSAYSPNWFNKKYVIYVRGKPVKQLPDIGDVGGIWFNNKGRIAHVVFIDEKWVNLTAFTATVEGNAGPDGNSRNGDGVYGKRRFKSQIYAVSTYI